LPATTPSGDWPASAARIATTTAGASENDSTRAVRDTARGSKNRTSSGTIRLRQGFAGQVKRLFREAGKAIAQRDDDPQPKPPRRKEDTGRAAFTKAAKKIMRRSLARRAFRMTKAIMARSRPAAAAFPAEAFEQPNPYNPLASAWQPIIGDGGFDHAFGDDVQPPNFPSANL
jgi:hypothetical protein